MLSSVNELEGVIAVRICQQKFTLTAVVIAHLRVAFRPSPEFLARANTQNAAILFSLQRRETSGEAKRAARRMGRGFSPSLHFPRGSLRRSERLHAGYHPIESTYVLSNPFLSKLSFGSETIPQSAQFLLVTRHFFLLFRAMREWRRRPLWSWGLLSLDSFLHLTFLHVIRPSLFSLTLKTKTFKKRSTVKKQLKARKRIYERGRVKLLRSDWLRSVIHSAHSNGFPRPARFGQFCENPCNYSVISLCPSSYTKVSRSAINLKIAVL